VAGSGGGAAGTTGAGGAAGAAGTTGSAGTGGAAACNTIPDTAPTITGNRVAENIPTSGQGGTILEGTYHLTDVTTYTGPGGATGPGNPGKQTMLITEGASGTFTAEIVRASTMRETQTLTPNGTNVMVQVTCPSAQTLGSFPYTSSGNTFILYAVASNLRFTFMRQ
jgi:pilus assembly protein FimV